MATQVVELTSDEAALLRGLDKVIQKEVQHAKQLAETAAAGGKAGDEIAAGFDRAQRESEKSMKAALRELAKFGPAGQAAATELRSSFEASGSFGFKGLDTVFADLEKLDPAAAQAARSAAAAIQSEMAAADAATEFNNTLTAIESLGGAASVAAKNVQASLSEPIDPAAALGGYLDAMRALGPEGQETADRIAMEFDRIDQQAEFDQTLSQLRAIGGDAAAIADGIAADMIAADAAAGADMNAILEKLKAIDPTVEASAETIKRQLAQAAQFSEKQYEGTLDKLRSMGPVGRAVAKELKEKLVDAGDLAEESIDDVIETLKEIDPAAAEAAKKIRENLQVSAKDGTTAFQTFGTNAAQQIRNVAGAYLGIQSAIQTVINLNEDVQRSNEDAFGALKGQELSRKRIVQVSNTTEEFNQNMAQADALSMNFGISREDAQTLVFDAISSGFEDALDFIASNDQSIDVQLQSKVAGKLPTLFKDEGLTAEQAIEVTLAASQNSVNDFSQVAAALPTAASASVLTGSTAAETSGALAAMAANGASIDQVATQIKALSLRLYTDVGETDADGNVTRESFAGQGLIGGVERIAELDEGARRDYFAGSKDDLLAFENFYANLQKIKDVTARAQEAIDNAGTTQAPSALRRAITEADPEFAAVKEAAIAEVTLEITREDRRAVDEGERQSRRDRALSAAEASGASAFSIAAAEKVAGFAAGFGQNDSGSIVQTIVGDGLTGLQRDLNLVIQRGEDSSADDVLLAANQLQKQRSKDAGALLSKDAVAQLVRGITGDLEMLPGDISDSMQLELTNAIVEQANASRGAERSLSVAFLRGVGVDATTPVLGGLLNGSVDEGSRASSAVNSKVLELLERNAAAIEQQNAIAQQQLDAANRTADNTKPTTPDPGAAQRAAAAATR